VNVPLQQTGVRGLQVRPGAADLQLVPLQPTSQRGRTAGRWACSDDRALLGVPSERALTGTSQRRCWACAKPQRGTWLRSMQAALVRVPTAYGDRGR
jgi:hypothetical protein